MSQAATTKHQSDYLFQKQTTFGTKDVTGMKRLNCEPTEIVPDVKVRESNRSRVGTTIITPNSLARDFKGSASSVALRGPVRREEILHQLNSVMQGVTQAGVGPFSWTFEVPATGQIDFQASPAGSWFGTFLKTNPVTAKSRIIRDCIGRRWKFAVGQDVNDGIAAYEWDLVGRGGMEQNKTDPTGIVTIGESYFNFFDITLFEIDDVSSGFVPLSLELEILTNPVPWGNDPATAGDFYSFALMHQINLKVKAAWTSAAAGIADDLATTGNQKKIELEFGTTGTAGNMKFTMYGEVEPSPDIEDDLKAIDLNFRAVDDGTNKPLSVIAYETTDLY